MKLAPRSSEPHCRLDRPGSFPARYRTSASSRQWGSLERGASFITDFFMNAGCEPSAQEYRVDQVEYRNVICSFGPQGAPCLVIGAHYDVYESPGADDNASGVAALIELACMIAAERPALEHRLDLVAVNALLGPNVTLAGNQYPSQLGGSGFLPGTALPTTGNTNNYVNVEFASAGLAAGNTWSDTGIPYAIPSFYIGGVLDIAFGGVEESLGGDTANVEAGATEEGSPLYAGDGEAQLCGADAGDVASGASADDDDIELCFAHVRYPVVAWWGLRSCL